MRRTANSAFRGRKLTQDAMTRNAELMKTPITDPVYDEYGQIAGGGR